MSTASCRVELTACICIGALLACILLVHTQRHSCRHGLGPDIRLATKAKGLVWQAWGPADHNLVPCTSCTFWVHERCDLEAVRAADLRGGASKPLYTCPSCRRIHEARQTIEVSRTAP